MSYFRSMGDPITDPSQVDDEIIAGTVAPTRVDCAALPADSPWKRPGQVCAPTPSFWDFLDKILPSSSGSSAAPSEPAGTLVTASPSPAGDSLLPLALLAVGGVGAYYLLRRKKKRT